MWALNDALPPLWVWLLYQCNVPRRAPELQLALEDHCQAHFQAVNSALRRLHEAGLLDRIAGESRAIWWRVTDKGREVCERNTDFLEWALTWQRPAHEEPEVIAS